MENTQTQWRKPYTHAHMSTLTQLTLCITHAIGWLCSDGFIILWWFVPHDSWKNNWFCTDKRTHAHTFNTSDTKSCKYNHTGKKFTMYTYIEKSKQLREKKFLLFCVATTKPQQWVKLVTHSRHGILTHKLSGVRF